jgi:hypothetical protein
MRDKAMTRNWFDKAAKRAADLGSSSRREVVNDVAARLIHGAPDRTPLDGVAVRSSALMSRRTGIKWAVGAGLGAAGVPLVKASTAEALLCGKQSVGVCLSDGAIISATDQFFEVVVAGQELEIFGLLDAALVFYEAAETLDSGCVSPDILCGGACCTAGQICCGCNGGFCLAEGGDCSSYC